MPDRSRQTPSDVAGSGRLLRSAGTVGALTLVSRLFGYARDMVVAALLGTTVVADAWFAAFELPNMLRRLASEGTLSAAFVPVFADTARRHGESEVWRLADRFHTAVLVAVTGLTLVGILVAPWIVPLLYPGFRQDPAKIALTVRLAQLVFAYALFISLSAVLMAVLNARERFAAAAFTPVLLNVSIIVFAVSAWIVDAESSVYYIVAGVIAGGLAQWLFLVPFARRAGMRFQFLADWNNPGLRQVGRLIVPRLLGVGVVQVNIIVGRMFATRLGDGPLAAMYYSARITELTLGVFAVSVATVVLPAMSRQGAAGDHAAMRGTLSFALRQVTAITLPAAVGLILLRQPIVAVLFQRGAFDADSTAMASAGLMGYAAGLVAVAAVRITAPGFYALHDTRTPVAAALVAMVVNIVGCMMLMGPLGIGGIALANSIAALASAALLLAILRVRLGGIDGGTLLRSICRIVAAAALMGWVVSALANRWLGDLGVPPALLGAGLVATIVVGTLTYVAALAVARAPELRELRAVLSGKLSASAGEPPDGSGAR